LLPGALVPFQANISPPTLFPSAYARDLISLESHKFKRVQLLKYLGLIIAQDNFKIKVNTGLQMGNRF